MLPESVYPGTSFSYWLWGLIIEAPEMMREEYAVC
ncbi:hypothetical protein BH11BAC5_BH11BAC5_24220 [soil metagenome]|jgi:hypothetical protein